MSILLTASMPFFIGAANIHPSIVDNADAEKAKVPILNIPTKDEPDMVSGNMKKCSAEGRVENGSKILFFDLVID